MSRNEIDEIDKDDHEMEIYGDDQLKSKDAKVPRWLFWSYLFWPIWGIFWFIYFFNGSHGWLDRGYWGQLQKAALTTFPDESQKTGISEQNDRTPT